MVGSRANFATRLAAAAASADSLLCLGLDPDFGSTCAEMERHCHRLLDLTLDSVCAVKPNVAYFEQYGSAGYAVLEGLRRRIPEAVLLIVDGKRGDIGHTAAAYARALFDVLGADAITVNPLLGGDSVAPFLERSERGVFVLARTSNPSASEFLDAPIDGEDRPLYERIVGRALGWPSAASLGFVVGATAPAAIRSIRIMAPQAPLLLPGLGAQGGTLELAVQAASAGDGCAVFPVSRGIARDPHGPAAAARRFRDAINVARQGAPWAAS